MTQYTELALAVDALAERIRALGFPAPGSYSADARLARVKEAQGAPTADVMLRQRAQDQAVVAKTAREIFPLADGGHDERTTDLLTQPMQVHEKTAWMLRAMLE